jgi:hypothetical protein
MNASGTTLRYRKKPVTIEAMRYPGLRELREAKVVLDWLDENGVDHHHPGELRIRTLEGEMTVSPGDWIIKGVQGEFYPCKPDIFSATYEVAEGAGPTVPELLEVLAGVVDCAIWQSGAAAYPEDSAWPEMREKLNRAIPYVAHTFPAEEPVEATP